MGVVELMQFRKTGDRRHLTLSKEYFLKARALWDKVNTYVTNATTHRAAFTLRRLGEVASEFGNQRESVKHLLKALRVFEKHGCIRYANEVEAAVIDQL